MIFPLEFWASSVWHFNSDNVLSLEIALTLPWNRNPTPGGMHHTGTGQTVQIPLPVTLQPITILLGLTVTCLAGVITGLLTAAGLAAREAGQTLREQ